MIQGFYTINSFINNTPGAINPVGELSEIGTTYAKSIQYFTGSNGTLNVFDVGGLSGSISSLAAVAVTALNGVPGYNTSSGTLINNMLAALGNGTSNVSIGNGVLNPIDNLLYPEWIQFNVTASGNTVSFKVWLVNASFLSQYPLGQIQLVYPINNLQLLFTNYTASAFAINSLNPTSLITDVATQVTGVVTGITTFTVNVYNAADTTQFFSMPIAVAYNGGPVFCNMANYILKLKSDLLASGAQTLNQWLNIIPALLPLSKFYFVPNWGNAAISNSALATPIISPTITVTDTTSFASTYFPDYASSHIVGFLDYTVMMYKSIGLFVLPDFTNLDGPLTFKAKFPDYFLVSVSDINLEQMSQVTVQMAVALDQVVRFAETWTTSTVLPAGYVLETRNNQTYVNVNVTGATLSVLTRHSALNLT